MMQRSHASHSNKQLDDKDVPSRPGQSSSLGGKKDILSENLNKFKIT
jgi:hypothetical protein